MNDVIGLIIIVVLVVLSGSVCGIIAFFKVTDLKRDITFLKSQLIDLQKQPVANLAAPHSATTSAESKPFENKTVLANDLQASFSKSMVYTQTPHVNTKQTVKAVKASFLTSFVLSLRSNLELHWMTWIGGVALALGGIFLAKYSLDAGLLSPSLRLALGGLFGVALIAGAEYLHSKGIVFEGFNNYVPAALAGGGFISCFALTLLAYSSYDMLSPVFAFIMLAVIALAASSMALRLGPLLAVLGIVGAYSVPIWVNTGSDNLAALLMYIGFVTFAAVLVAQQVKRPWLWYLLWAGHIGWYWLALSVSNAQQIWIVGGFALLSIIGLIAIARLGLTLRLLAYRPHSLQRLLKLQPDHSLLLAIVMPLLLAIVTSAVSLQWQIVMVCLIVMLLFLVLQNSRWDLWQGVALLVAVLFVISQQNNSIDYTDNLFVFTETYGIGLLFAVGFFLYGLYFGTHYYKRLTFHLVAAFSVFSLIATLYTITPEQGLGIAYPLWSVLLLFSSCVLIKRAQPAHTQWQQFSYWIGANANITLCLTMLLAESGLTLALSIQVLLISYVARRYKVPMPLWPIKVLVAVVLARLTFAQWTYDADLTFLAMHWSMVVYPVCVVLFWFASKQWQQTEIKIWLEGAALHCLALFITTETSYQLVGHYPQPMSLSFYEQVLLSCNWLALGCVYLYRSYSAGQLETLYRIAGFVLVGLASVLLMSTALYENPLLIRLYMGEMPLFNWVLFTWCVPSVLTLWLATLVKPLNAELSQVILGLSGLLAVLAINGLIRQYWQGPFIYLDKATSDAELYSYSIIWLLLGALVVIAGHLKQQSLVQKVGLGILGAVIVKVFLIDMANLTGLLKAVSFIGLGLSLVGLSWLFQKLRNKNTSRLA